MAFIALALLSNRAGARGSRLGDYSPGPFQCHHAALSTPPAYAAPRTMSRRSTASLAGNDRKVRLLSRRRRRTPSSIGAGRDDRKGIHRIAPARGARGIEREYLIAQITRFNGNISRTAEFVGMDRSSLHRKMRELRIKLRPHKSGRLKKNAPNP
jgi:hypothetical protein